MAARMKVLDRLRGLRATPKALLVQLLAAALVLMLFRMGQVAGGAIWPMWVWVPAQAAVAAGLAHWLRSDRWWLWIHLGFGPAALVASLLHIPALWYLALFGLLAVIYGSHYRSQVPLFLSNATTAQTVLGVIPDNQPLRFLDFGSGLGGVVRTVAAQRPQVRCEGVEGALGPALLARLLAIGLGNARLRWGDFWKTDLSEFDVVYAFLSPVPMPALWDKACREMKTGALLISNSFPIPDVKPVRRIQVDDKRSTQLYLYRIPALPKKFSTQ